MESQQIIVAVLVAVAVGGLFWAFAYPALSGGKRVEARQKAIYGGDPKERLQTSARDSAARRAQVAETLKELEAKQKQRRSPPLHALIERAGLDWSRERFVLVSALTGFGVFVLAFLAGGNLLVAAAAAFAGALGLPRWGLLYLIRRRQGRFIEEFPNAIDIIVRGVKAGLPLGDCIRIVAGEAQPPLKAEFRQIVETQTVGMPLSEAVQRMYDRIGVSEANFFAIVITIQQTSGGNLSEALGNLSRVLRERRKMQGKIKAMSMEAKASATIIGALPILVGFGVYVMSPDYISVLWQSNLGLVMLGASALWMLMGVLTMRKMINFDF